MVCVSIAKQNIRYVKLEYIENVIKNTSQTGKEKFFIFLKKNT